MVPNVIGVSQYADGGRMTTKSCTSAGAYVHRMSDLCGPCRQRPGDRTGGTPAPAPPATGPSSAGTANDSATTTTPPGPVRQPDRLPDLAEMHRRERARHDTPP